MMLLSLVACQPLLQVLACLGKLPQVNRSSPAPGGLRRGVRALADAGLGGRVALRARGPSGAGPALHKTRRVPPQHPEELRRFLDLLAQQPRTGVRGAHLRGGKAPGDHQRRAERELQSELLLHALGPSGNVGSEARPWVKWTTASASAARVGALAGLPKYPGPGPRAPPPCSDGRAAPAGSRRSPESAPPTPGQCADGTAGACCAAGLIRRLLDQGMLEDVRRLEQPLLVQELGLDQLVQPTQGRLVPGRNGLQQLIRKLPPQCGSELRQPLDRRQAIQPRH